MEKVKLLDVVDIKNNSVSEYKGLKRYIATGDVDKDVIKSYNEVSYSNRPSRANIEVKEGQVIFARMKKTNKVLTIDESNKNYIYSTGFCVLEPKKGILSEYLSFILLSEQFQSQKDKYSKGATQKSINNESLTKIKIQLPSLNLQKNIVDILKKLHTIIYKRNQQLDFFDKLIKFRYSSLINNEKEKKVIK